MSLLALHVSTIVDTTMYPSLDSEEEPNTDHLAPIHLQIVGISLLLLDEECSRLVTFKSEYPEDEPELIDRCMDALVELDYPTIVTFNGGSYDLPVIYQRAFKHGIDAGPLLTHNEKGNYLNRYHSGVHIDLLDQLRSFQIANSLSFDDVISTLPMPNLRDSEAERLAAYSNQNFINLIEDTELFTVYLGFAAARYFKVIGRGSEERKYMRCLKTFLEDYSTDKIAEFTNGKPSTVYRDGDNTKIIELSYKIL